MKAARTGGVYGAGSGWGSTLTGNLDALGVKMKLQPPGEPAVAVVTDWLRANDMI